MSVAELKRLNPQAIHPKGWLWVGERLLIPGKPPTVEPPTVEPPKTESPKAVGYWYQVRPKDTWNTVAKATGVSVRQLWAANPGLRNRQQWLYLGQRVWIPAAPPATPVTAAASPTAVATTSAAADAAATPTAPAPTAAPAATPSATAAAASKPRTVAGCPETFAGYPDAIAARLNLRGKTPKDLQAWLAACGALAEGDSGVTLAALQSPTSADIVVAIVDPDGRVARGQGCAGGLSCPTSGRLHACAHDRWQGCDHPVGGRRHQCGREKRSGVDRHDLRRAVLLLDAGCGIVGWERVPGLDRRRSDDGGRGIRFPGHLARGQRRGDPGAWRRHRVAGRRAAARLDRDLCLVERRAVYTGGPEV